MNRLMPLKIALIAAVCFGLGFLMADRMTPANASSAMVAQETGAAFSGSDGAVVLGGRIFVIRGSKIYRVDPSDGGAHRPWGELNQ